MGEGQALRLTAPEPLGSHHASAGFDCGVASLDAWLKPPQLSVAPGSAKLVLTSPPYLNVMRYGKFNWIRLWLLKESVERVDPREGRNRLHAG